MNGNAVSQHFKSNWSQGEKQQANRNTLWVNSENLPFIFDVVRSDAIAWGVVECGDGKVKGWRCSVSQRFSAAVGEGRHERRERDLQRRFDR